MMTHRAFPSLVLWLPLCLFAFLCSNRCVGEDHVLDDAVISTMYKDAETVKPTLIPALAKGTMELWIKALKRPEDDLKREVSIAVIRVTQEGVKGLEKMIKPLLEEHDAESADPAVRLATAQALIVLDARQAAPSLFRAAQSGTGVYRMLVEPALASWDHQPMRKIWLERLEKGKTLRRELIIAIRSLARVGEGKAVDPLRKLCTDTQAPYAVRLESAQALGKLVNKELEDEAAKLMQDSSPQGIVNRLVAATMLQQHNSAKAIDLLKQLIQDKESAVVAQALPPLIRIDARHVVPSLDQIVASQDPKVRLLAVEVLFQVPEAKHLRLLGDGLADSSPEVRQEARKKMHHLATTKKMLKPILDEGMRILHGESWQGQEQATILLAQLDHKPAAKRLVALLDSGRPEVLITAAWALRSLAVKETLAPVAAYVDRQHKRLVNPETSRPLGTFVNYLDHQLSHLNQFLGQQKHAPADQLLRRFVPRNDGIPVGPESRAAAIWALGIIHAGKPEPALVRAFEERLNDIMGFEPEDQRVRMMSAISLGRMEAASALPSLEKYAAGEGPTSPMHASCVWAIAQITKKPLTRKEIVRTIYLHSFLRPTK